MVLTLEELLLHNAELAEAIEEIHKEMEALSAQIAFPIANK